MYTNIPLKGADTVPENEKVGEFSLYQYLNLPKKKKKNWSFVWWNAISNLHDYKLDKLPPFSFTEQ